VGPALSGGDAFAPGENTSRPRVHTLAMRNARSRREGRARAAKPDGCPTFAPAYPSFLLRSIGQDRVCGFLQGKPHGVRQRHQRRQEIGVRGTIMICFHCFPWMAQQRSPQQTTVTGAPSFRAASRLAMAKTTVGLRPSSQSHVRWGERGAPVRAGEMMWRYMTLFSIRTA